MINFDKRYLAIEIIKRSCDSNGFFLAKSSGKQEAIKNKQTIAKNQLTNNIWFSEILSDLWSLHVYVLLRQIYNL